MCPACISALALVVGGVTSAGGLSALILHRRRVSRGAKNPQPESAPKKESR